MQAVDSAPLRYDSLEDHVDDGADVMAAGGTNICHQLCCSTPQGKQHNAQHTQGVCSCGKGAVLDLVQ